MILRLSMIGVAIGAWGLGVAIGAWTDTIPSGVVGVYVAGEPVMNGDPPLMEWLVPPCVDVDGRMMGTLARARDTRRTIHICVNAAGFVRERIWAEDVWTFAFPDVEFPSPTVFPHSMAIVDGECRARYSDSGPFGGGIRVGPSTRWKPSINTAEQIVCYSDQDPGRPTVADWPERARAAIHTAIAASGK